MSKQFLKFLYITTYSCLLLTSCAVKNNPSRYKVEVKDSTGKKIEALDNLVTRVELRTKEDKDAFGLIKKNNNILSLKPYSVDGKKIVGLKLISGTKASNLMKLRTSDIITAFGTKKATSNNDINTLLKCLKNSKECSLTYERQGRAFKVYLYLI